MRRVWHQHNKVICHISGKKKDKQKIWSYKCFSIIANRFFESCCIRNTLHINNMFCDDPDGNENTTILLTKKMQIYFWELFSIHPILFTIFTVNKEK